MKIFLSVLSIFFAFMLFAAVPSADAAEPRAQLESTIDNILVVLADPAFKGDEKMVERRAKLSEVIEDRFNYREMSMRSLGKHWRKLSDDQKKEFVVIFTKLIQGSYIEKIERYTEEKVLYQDAKIVKNKAEVKTKIVTLKGTEIPINYRLKLKGGKNWMVYDVVVEGVSLVSNYRTQFANVLSSSSFEQLVSDLKAKTN